MIDLCRREMDLSAMVEASPFYRNKMPDSILQRIFETHMIRKMLTLLVAEGRVKAEYGRVGVLSGLLT